MPSRPETALSLASPLPVLADEAQGVGVGSPEPHVQAPAVTSELFLFVPSLRCMLLTAPLSWNRTHIDRFHELVIVLRRETPARRTPRLF